MFNSTNLNITSEWIKINKGKQKSTRKHNTKESQVVKVKKKGKLAGINTIKYHTLAETPCGKVTKHKELSHTSKPRIQPFPIF